jgi:hypothetical protein
VTGRAKEFRVGDVVKVEVTMSNGSIKFFCNDALQGKGRGVQQGMVPYVALGTQGDQATLLSISR